MKKGYKHSKETQEKMKNARLLFFKNGGSNWIKGKKHSEEALKKIRIARAKQTPPWLGKKRDAATIEKMRQANIGKRRSPGTEFKKGHVPWDKDKKLHYDVYQKGKPMLRFHGDKNPHWKGGITPANKKIRRSMEYSKWRRSVFKRDNWTCINCKEVGGRLIADHIKPFSLYPELRFAIDNGRTLCVGCDKILGWKYNIKKSITKA